MTELENTNAALIRHLSLLPNDNLFAQIGANILGEHRGAFPRPFSKLVEEGHRWFAETETAICNHLCNLPVARSLVDESDQVHLALTLMGLLGHVVEPVNVACLAIILSRIGIREICSAYWT